MSSYEVHLEVFEGPFDLLLTLIGERRVDVCDVPIARLTEDYLARLSLMRDLDLDPATEFLVVAATLLQLKARALMPTVRSGDEDEEDQLERDVLIARLLEVRTFQAVGSLLADLLADGDLYQPPAPAADDPALRVLPTLAGIDAAALARSLTEIVLDRARPVDTSTLLADEISPEEACAEVLERAAQGALTFRTLVAGRDIHWAVALFLAMLELSMRGEVRLGQGERLGDIEITTPATERT